MQSSIRLTPFQYKIPSEITDALEGEGLTVETSLSANNLQTMAIPLLQLLQTQVRLTDI